jgi:hypothetical protein
MAANKNVSRPFGQGIYRRELLRPTFDEFNYKFRILLPVSEYTLGSAKPPKPVFLSIDLRNLDKLFREDFGGLTRPMITPSAIGQYIMGTTEKTVANEHAIFEVFSLRTREALNYFVELKERLEIRSEQLGAKQDIIAIEQSEVTFAARPSFNKQFLELILRRQHS